MGRLMRIGVLVDRGRAYGRRLCEGVAAYATARGGWELTTLDYDSFETRGFDAFIARVLDRRIMKKLKAVGKPVVDVYCALPCADFLHVDGDQVEEGRQAARYFIEHRFENFAFCGYDGWRFRTSANGGLRRNWRDTAGPATVTVRRLPYARTSMPPS